VRVGKEFFLAVISFVLLGSTMRVVSDSVDTGVMGKYVMENGGSAVAGAYSAILSSHLYDYKQVSNPLDIVFALHSPGIYFMVGGLFLLTIAVCCRFSRLQYAKFVGLALWLPNFLLLAPMMRYLIYGAVVLALVCFAYFASKMLFKRFGIVSSLAAFVVLAHSIDGAATFTVIDIYNKFEPACTLLNKCYFEQHVLSNAIGQIFAFTGVGFLLYFIVKAAFSFVAAYFICREAQDENERNYLFLLIIVFGLAPGIRDVLRMVCGA